jgi:hypothetical protein
MRGVLVPSTADSAPLAGFALQVSQMQSGRELTAMIIMRSAYASKRGRATACPQAPTPDLQYHRGLQQHRRSLSISDDPELANALILSLSKRLTST